MDLRNNTDDKLENERVCSRHFVSGQAAQLSGINVRMHVERVIGLLRQKEYITY